MSSWRTNLLLVALTYVAAVANTSIAPRMAVGHAAPDLLAVLAMVWISLAGGDRRFVAAAAIGLAWDLCGGERLGLGMGCFLLAGFGLQFVQLKLAYHHPAFRLATTVPAVIALHLLLAWCQWLAAGMGVSLAVLSGQALVMGVYTAAICVLTLVMLQSFARQRQFS